MDSCAQCGAPLDVGAVSCARCGAPVVSTAAGAPTTSGGPGAPPAGPASSAPSAASSTGAIPPFEIVLMASAALMLIGSFFDVYKAGPLAWSSWSNALDIFPALTLAVLGVVVVGAVVAVKRFAGNLTLPDAIERDLPAISTLVVVTSALVVITFAIRAGGDLPLSRGVGAYLILVAAVGMVVGIVMRAQGAPAVRPAAGSSGGTLQPFGIVAIAGGAVALIGSFLPNFGGSGSSDYSAWSTTLGLPALTLPAILAVAAAVLVALDQLGTLSGDSAVLGIPLRRWARALGIESGALMVCFLVGESGVTGASFDHKIGFWLMLLGTIAVAVAVIMGPKLTFPTGSSTAPPQS